MADRPAAAARSAARLGLVAPLGAAAAGALSVAGLVMRVEGLGSPSQPAVMVPLTSLGIFLAAFGLMLTNAHERGPAARALGRCAALTAAALGLLTLGHYAAGGGSFFGADAFWARLPGPGTGLALTAAGGSLVAHRGRTQSTRRWADPCAVATALIALVALIGHAYGASQLYGLNRWGGTSVATAVALLCLAVGTLFAFPERGFAKLVSNDRASGQLLRRVIPAALLAPALLGWLALLAQQFHAADAAFGTALLTAAFTVLLVAVIIRRARTLDAAELQRDRSLARERAAHEGVNRILESITDAFFAVDRSWRFTYANREAERVLQRPRTELIGRTLWEEFPEAVGATFEREYRRAMAEQKAVEFEELFPPLNAWFEVRAYPSPDGLSVYFRDVTARMRAQEQLSASEARYRLLADMIPQHIWTTAPDGYHQYFSRRWFEFTGATLEETRGEGWMKLLHPDDRERTLARWNEALRTGEPYAIEYRFRGADGEYRWFLGQAAPLRDERGEITQWFGTLTDISERKRRDEERERLHQAERAARTDAERRREELERVSESRAALIRGFSHDVRNALSIAYVSADLLERGSRSECELSDKQRASSARIRRSIQTSLRLIDDLLELARAEAGALELECVRTDVSGIARELADDYRARATERGLDLVVRLPERLPAETDPTRLRQIVMNLLSNAVKYASPGTITVEAELRRGGELIAVTVADSGPGIPEDKQELIFQEYTRLDPNATQGAGIGLAISRRIARLLGGDITLQSEEGGGSRFTVWLPSKCAVSSDVVEALEGPPAG